jgi:hypothetical protein
VITKTVSIPAATAIRGTGKAILCRIPTAARVFECWVPRSQIAEQSEVQDVAECGVLVVSEWWWRVSGTCRQFPERPATDPAPLKKGHGGDRKSNGKAYRLKDTDRSLAEQHKVTGKTIERDVIGGFREEDFDFEGNQPREPEANAAKVEITDEDVPF